ncbi:MAG: VCBS repeat-containing protein [Verrucomicrobiae bacterium]|nr:VCBS repeat-containing protein [Verrucomicrobiae bacterium]
MKRFLPFVLSLGFVAAQAADTPEPRFRAVTVDDQIAIGYGLAIADVDGDGRPDIVLADKSQVVWYRNPGWEKFVIAEQLTPLDNVCVAAADVDGDGKAEIAVGAGWNPGDTVNSGALFYLLPPADRTQRWEPIALPHEPTMHRIQWARDWQGQMTLLSVPLHGRGNDPAKGEGAGVRIQRYRPPGDPSQPWEVTTLDESLNKTHNFDVVAWDDDPAPEVLVGARQGVFLLDWSRESRSNVRIPIASDVGGGAGEVRMGRLGSGRFVAAVEPMHGNTLALYRPSPAGGTNLWTRRVLDEALVDGHALVCGDFLGIGRDQVVVGWRAMNRPGVRVGIKMYIPEDDQGARWREVLLDDNGMACEDLRAADLDGDGHLDLIAAGRATKNVKIYLNER